MIIRKINEFRGKFSQLQKGDAFVGNLVLRPGEEFIPVDIINRGIIVFPPLSAQLLSRSKIFQAEILGGFMVEDTFVAYKNKDIMRNMPRFAGHTQVVCKRDRKHLGLGLSRWDSLESLQSLAAMETLPFPFVVQPFVPNARDIRVVIIEDYCEAYEKINPYSFRKNLAHGGTAHKIKLTPELDSFCRRVMARGEFPYAILDILVDESDRLYLSEITLTGGLTGSRLGQEEFRKRKKSINNAYASSLGKSHL
ncbi:ATP-grasp domain-containing protein [Desulfonatronovibrio hydrogenovorans]|uniref:ATP-grasp domain-containing protein n=1 Tax=Desulfonatronovibrio hydrogenovorans TaxID=53245 RepID=UPI00054FC1E4|nr:hypothetical protein [Desulfonatronovibrio hydrogenovorans]